MDWMTAELVSSELFFFELPHSCELDWRVQGWKSHGLVSMPTWQAIDVHARHGAVHSELLGVVGARDI